MIFTIFVFSQCSVLAMVIVVQLLHKFIPLLLENMVVFLFQWWETHQKGPEYITLILGMSYESAMLAHFTLRGIFMEFEKRSHSAYR